MKQIKISEQHQRTLGLTTLRNVTCLPALPWIHCVAPDSVQPRRIRVAAVVLCCCTTTVRKSIICQRCKWLMGYIRWPLLALASTCCRIDLSDISSSCFIFSAYFTVETQQIILTAGLIIVLVVPWKGTPAASPPINCQIFTTLCWRLSVWTCAVYA